jgi:hypothetical protein
MDRCIARNQLGNVARHEGTTGIEIEKALAGDPQSGPSARAIFFVPKKLLNLQRLPGNTLSLRLSVVSQTRSGHHLSSKSSHIVHADN